MATARHSWRQVVLLAGICAGAPIGASLLSAWPSSALAAAPAEQELTFQLLWQGRPAGTHTTTVRHYAPKTPGGEETRIIESFEDIQSPDLPEASWRRTRSTARSKGTTLSFTSVTELGPSGSGRVTEVNGRRDSDGAWTLHITRGQATETLNLRRSQADLCTLDLIDPILHERMVGRGVVRLLDVTTGEVLDGTARDEGELVVEIAGQSAAVRRYSMEANGQLLQWDWNLEGILVHYDTRLGGGPLTAMPELLPPLRSWGTIETSPRFDNGVPILQGEL